MANFTRDNLIDAWKEGYAQGRGDPFTEEGPNGYGAYHAAAEACADKFEAYSRMEVSQYKPAHVERYAAACYEEGQGTWLWGRLMDWCKFRGIAPAGENALFGICEAARKEFTRALSAEKAGWRDIATAPKDEFILVGPTKRMYTCVAMNHSRDGWVTETPGEWVSIYTPTAWQPLPASPTPDKEG